MMTRHTPTSGCFVIRLSQDLLRPARKLSVLGVLSLLTIMLMLCGCSTGVIVDMSQDGSPIHVPNQTEPLLDATLAHVQGNWSRAISEMDRTCRATEWSLMKIERTPPAKSKAHPKPPQWFTARAMMTTGSIAQIFCWPGEKNTITVAVRAGLFGNKAVEAKFVRNLADNLAKAPVPDRSITFDMPSLKDYQRDDQPADGTAELK